MSTISVNGEQKPLVQLEKQKQHLPLPVDYEIPVRQYSEYTDDLLRRMYKNMPAADSLVIGVCSSNDCAATTVTGINLATRANDFLLTPTAIVDAGAGRVSKKLGAKRPGFAEFVSGQSSLADCTTKNKGDDLVVMGIGRRGRMTAMQPAALRELREEFRLSLIELPSLLEPSPLDGLIPELDGVVIVAEYGQRKRDLKRMTERIRLCGGHVVGLVMTGKQSFVPKWIRDWF